MKLTNRLNLPASIVQAVANDPYSAGKSDISVTRLIAPPYQVQLAKQHREEIVEDAADRIWSLMGQIGHSIVERMDIDPETSVAEKRLFSTVYLGDQSYVVSGQFDLIEDHTLIDFKFTSVFSRDGKQEWTEQTNLLAALCDQHYRETGDARYLIKRTQIVAVFRDWQKAKAGMGDYPTSQVAVIPTTLWPEMTRLSFLRERLAQHMQSEPKPCTDKERWATDPVFAVMKKGRKSAVKLFLKQEDAEAMAAVKGKDHTVVHRPVEFKRCASYCSAAEFCPQWNAHKAEAPF